MRKVLLLLSPLLLMGAGCETEGLVNIDDCRIIVEKDEYDLSNYFKSFVCQTEKTYSGNIMEGTCVNVDLTLTGACNKVIMYKKEPDIRCPKGAPYLGHYDQCHMQYELGRVKTFKD